MDTADPVPSLPVQCTSATLSLVRERGPHAPTLLLSLPYHEDRLWVSVTQVWSRLLRDTDRWGGSQTTNPFATGGSFTMPGITLYDQLQCTLQGDHMSRVARDRPALCRPVPDSPKKVSIFADDRLYHIYCTYAHRPLCWAHLVG